MSSEERSALRRAVDACREALGVPRGPDPLRDVEEAAYEVRVRLAHLEREVFHGSRTLPQGSRPAIPSTDPRTA